MIRRISDSETVQYRTKVAVDHQYEVVYSIVLHWYRNQ